MLQDVLHPPESHFPEDLAVPPASFFDFAEDDVLLAETLSNQPDVCSSNSSGDTLFSSSSPSADSNRNTPVLAAASHLTGTPQQQGVDFPTSYAPALTFHDQFDLSSIHHLSSSASSYEDNAAGTGFCYVFGQAGASLDSSSPMPCSFGPPFEAEVECLLPFIDFAQAATLGLVQPGGLSPTAAAARGRACRPMHQTEPGIMAAELEIHAESLGGVFSAESMRGLYSAGDMQEKGQVVGGGGCGTALTSDAPPLEESGFKIGRYSVEERKQRIHRYMKKRNQRNFNKKIKYACRKTLADSRPRVRGRFAKNDDFGDATRTHHFEDDDEVDNADYKEQDLIDSSDIFAHISGVNSFDTNNPIQSWI
ncbi:uncharacterized protein LOC116266078 [Nymphaea colorata]|nr:uncharacterized protein LOC116266078 [Nymphaea colorata]